jgi:tetratricopeptide (TPR) repeat protein
MKKIVLAFLFVINLANAQEKIPFIYFDSIQPQIEKSEKEKDYTKALALINSINKNDSMYFSILPSKTNYLLQLKKYDEVIATANEGINTNHKRSKALFYINKGIALTELKKYDEALETYNEALKIYTKNYVLWFNNKFDSTYWFLIFFFIYVLNNFHKHFSLLVFIQIRVA